MVLHGLFGSSGNWRGIARELAGHALPVHCVDLRNHGASPWADSMGYVEMADDVLQLIERERLRSPARDRPQHGRQDRDGAGAAPARRRSAGWSSSTSRRCRYADTLTPFAEAMRSADVVGGRQPRRGAAAPAGRPCPDAGVVPFLMQNLRRRATTTSTGGSTCSAISAGDAAALCGFPSALLGAALRRAGDGHRRRGLGLRRAARRRRRSGRCSASRGRRHRRRRALGACRPARRVPRQPCRRALRTASRSPRRAPPH